MEPRPLEQLFARWRDAHDLAALAEAFDRIAPELLAVARKLVRHEAEAEDLVQATFLAALEGAERYDASRPLVPWLVGILTHGARRSWRARRGTEDAPERAAGVGDDPAARAEHAELRAALERALVHVPPAYRDVVRQHLAEELAPEEIARRMARPKGTVRVQLHRGLRHLRRLLPAGLALGAGATLAPRGLAAVRAEVVRAGSMGTAPLALTGGGLGGIAMTKKLAAALAVVVLVGVVWRGAHRSPGARGELAPERPVELVSAPADALELLVEEPRGTRAALEPAPRAVTAGAASDAGHGDLDLRVTWWDGTPAADVSLRVLPLAAPQPYQAFRLGSTDSTGAARFAGLRAGNVLVTLNGGLEARWSSVAVEAGRATTAEVVLARGVDVAGRVVDASGAPVAGARLWVKSHLAEFAHARGASAADGTFRLRSLATAAEIVATADGVGCSVSTPIALGAPIAHGEPGVRRLELRLDGDVGAVEGVVRDAEGAPLAGAQVLLRCANTRSDRTVERWAWIVVPSDAAGRFRAGGLHAGGVTLSVAAPGHALHVETLVLESRATAHIDVHLRRGFTVAGTVTLPDGSPGAGVELEVGPLLVDDELFRLTTETDASGRYELAHLAPGEAVVTARAAEGVLEAHARLSGADGERVTLDVRFGTGPALRGRVVDERGAPLVGWRVRAFPYGPETAGGSAPASTDERGRFELTDLGEGTYSVRAYAPGDVHQAMARALVERVRPDADELELVVRGEREPAAFVSGRILGPDGVALRASLGARRLDRLFWVTESTWNEDDRFRLGPLLSGEYELSVSAPDSPWLAVPFTIAAGAELDLGDIALPAPARVRVSLRRADGRPIADATTVTLFREPGPHAVQLGRDGDAADLVPPGRYRPRVLAPDASLARVEPIEIGAGAVLDLELVLVAGRTVQLDFAAADGELHPADVRVVVHDGDGVLRVDELRRLDESQDRASLSCLASLPVGTATFTARCSDGREASGKIAVEPAGDGTWLRVPVRLRSR